METKQIIFKKVNQITIGASLALLALGSSVSLQSCGSEDNTSENGEYEEVETLTKGVISNIKETESGIFKIENETITSAETTGAIVSYLDGRIETISSSKAQIIIDDEIRMHPDAIGKTPTLPNTLLFGGVGYFLANLPGSNLKKYRNDANEKVNSSKTDSLQNRRHHSSGLGFFPMFWLTRAAFSSGFSARESMAGSRMRVSRPVSGRSGFFKGSSRGGFFS